jgi:PAS domain S-box-containing protein
MHKIELEKYKRALDEVAYISTTDGKGRITYINDKYCKLTKYTREELIGQDNRIFKSGYHTREFYDNMYKELYSGNIFKIRFKNKAKDGSLFWLDATIIPFLNEEGIPYEFLSVQFDITDEINEVGLKEEFLADISHEIRTPLHGLLSMVDLLTGTNLNEEQKDYVTHIKETSNHLGHLVNDLLDVFKIDSGKLQFETIPFNIEQLVKSLVEIFNLNETTKKISFIYNLDKNIQSTLQGDPNRLRQILYNLLDNALKFTKEGTISIELRLASETTDNQYVEFKVIDTGVGIPIEKQKGIFDKFVQSGRTDPRFQNDTGLGMSIVKNLIGLQNGKLDFVSTVGKGTIFTFTIPYSRVTDNAENQSENPVSLSETKKYKILIAEDDKINQLIYKKQLAKFNHDFTVAEDGFEALEFLQKESFDLLLLDMQMPGMNGDEVLRKIRFTLPEPIRHIPVICVSATVHPKIIQSLIDAGADGYLTKPYKENELAEIIIKTLKNRNTKSEENEQSRPNSLINLELLNQFAEGDIDFIIELLEYFKTTTPDVLESMQQNFRLNNIELSRQLHKYRSQVSLLGLNVLTLLSLTLETALLETADFEPYRKDFEDLIAQSQEVLVEVVLLITKLKSNSKL